jgi:hypothetical protein
MLEVVSPYGTAVPSVGVHLYDPGSVITSAIIDSPVVLVDSQSMMLVTSTGWVGTGSVPVQGIDTNTGPFTINVNSTIVWLWELTDRVLSNMVESGTVSHQATRSIELRDGYHVSESGNVIMEAGEEIRMLPEFSARTGSVFRAIINTNL